ncbi:MAG: heavy metal-binding domain-containing protein [bacterium]
MQAQAREQALQRLTDDARKMNADVVVSIRMTAAIEPDNTVRS